ncbi:hypothetical protein TNIN_84821 [Trichonephila inaurata madagascariensis]|uniref:Uncharacterized protein n=1 Tax=Trichonephila inaurata madagascariensis TaxID=2747483 RepID=A0A8X6J4N3_9ARAC|nr:hypothetical protein TNIN_84821 [Trichonephila inaurata madagascariensis]
MNQIYEVRRQNPDRKGVNLNRRKDVRYFKPKGEGEPTCLITEAKKHDPQDYFCNKFQTYDTDHFNRNVEELCKFQGKFTPEDDELSPNYKASSASKLKPAHLSVSEDEMNPDLKKSSEYLYAPAPLSVSEMVSLLPPDDAELEIISPPTDEQK